MWPSPQFPADLVSFTKENLNGKLQFLCSVIAISGQLHSEAATGGVAQNRRS